MGTLELWLECGEVGTASLSHKRRERGRDHGKLLRPRKSDEQVGGTTAGLLVPSVHQRLEKRGHRMLIVEGEYGLYDRGSNRDWSVVPERERAVEICTFEGLSA